MLFHDRLRISAQTLTLLLALGADALAAPKTVKENGGQANSNATYVENSAPGKSDVVKIDGSTKKVTLADAVTEWGAVDFSAGSIDGNKKLILSLTESIWTGGVIDGATLSTPGITIGAGAEKKLQGAGQLEIVAGGTASWTGDDLITGGGAEIKNSGTFTTNFSGKITKTSGENSKFTNSGGFVKNTAGTTIEIQATFDSKDPGSNVTVNGGTLRLTGGGESSKAVSLGNGAKLEISDTDYVFSGGALDATGTGSIDVTSAIATFGSTTGSANLTVSGSGTARVNGSHSTTGRLKLSAGKLDATTTSGAANVGGFDWTGGDVASVIVNSGDTTIAGTGPKKLYGGAKLNLSGSTNWSADSIGTGGAAEIINTGTFTTSFDGLMAHNQGGTRATFKNEGNFTKSNATSGTTEIQAAFENTAGGASVTVGAGTLKLSGGGRSSKAVTIGNGASLEIAATDFAFEGGAINGSTGKLKLSDKITTFSNATGGDAEVVVDGPNANAKFDGTHTGTGKLKLVQGTLSGAGDATFASVDWNGGTLSGKVKSTGSTTLSGGSKSLSGELTLGGNTAWDGSPINTSGTAKIKNESGRTFSVTADGLIAASGSARFANEGTLDKAGGTGVTDIHTAFDSTGTVSVGANKGTLRLSGGGKTSGNVGLGSGATLQVTANNYEFENVTHSGGGVIEVASSNATFRNATGSAKLAVSGGQAVFDASNSTAGELALLAGSVTSTNGGEATVGSLLWSGGSLNAKVKSNGNAVIGGGAKSISGGDLTLAGTTTWDGTTLATSNGAKLKNEATGTFNAADGAITHSAGTRGTFTNAGQFNKNSGTGSTVLDTLFENSGTVTVSSGKLKLSQGAANADNSRLEVAAGAELELNGDVTLTAKAELKGNGKARFLGLTLLANALIEIATFDFDGGTLTGSNRFNGLLNWNDGNWNSAGNTTIAQGAVLNLNKNSTHEFNGRSVVNEGTINWYAGNLRAGNGSIFTNEAVFNDLNGGTKTILAPGGFGGTFSFTNNGLYKKTTGGTTTMEVPFVNNGTMEIAAGSVVFAGTFTNNGSVLMRNGASAHFSAPLTFGPTHPLSGTGVIDAPHVTAEGLVSPGTSPGMLTVTGDLTLLSTSELLIDLASPIQGTGYDFMNVGGAANLGGSQIKLTLLNGFGASILSTDTFTVLTAGTNLSGVFANVASGQRLFMVDGVGSFQVNYGTGSTFAGNSVVLSNFSPVPEPSTYALIGIGAVLIGLHLRRRTHRS